MIYSTVGGRRRNPISFRYLAIAGAGIWLLLLVAGVSAYVYREIDGPSVRTLLSENLVLKEQLTEANDALGRAQNQLRIANTRNSNLNTLLTRSMIDSERTRALLKEMMSAAPSYRLPLSLP